MRMRRLLAGLLLTSCVWAGTAGTAPVHDWFVSADVPVIFDVRVPGDRNKQTTLGGTDVKGLMVAVGTAYHVGFGLDVISGKFHPQPGFDIELQAVLVDVFVDIPIEAWTLVLGAGWGE